MNNYLNLVIGPMFAGKTTRIIKHIRKLKDDQINFISIKPSIDTRYDKDKICSHDKDSEDCIVLDKDKIESLKDDKDYKDSKVIIIEEGQFFKNLFEFVDEEMKNGKSFIIAGLDGDYRRKPFGDMLKLIPLSDTVNKLYSYCKECGIEKQVRAPFTKRIIKTKKQELVGGEEMYHPVCRNHYNESDTKQNVNNIEII